MEMIPDKSNDDEILSYLKKLEARISRIEGYLDLKEISEADTELEKTVPKSKAEKTDELELRIGEFWFAKVGIVILSIGIIFLLTLPYENLPPILPNLFGFAIVGGLFVLSYYWRKSFSLISQYLFGGGLLLIYFSIFRLHFFSTQPAIENISIELLLLVIVVIINLFISVRRKSIYLAGLNLILGYITALVSDQPLFLFVVIMLLSALAVYFKLKFNWENLFILGIVLTYLSHFIWAINNPLIGNKIQIVAEPYFNLVFLIAYTLIFASGNFFREKGSPESIKLITSTFLNVIGCYGLFLLITLNSFKPYLALSHFIVSLIFLAVSVLFWLRHKSKFSTFFYEIIGYSALSVAIINQFDLPDYFIVLSWQSLLVISAAIWFKSRIIIIANFVLYLIILIVFLFMAGEVSIVSVSFGIVALISARILNWQKDYLEIKTEFMRNAYLTVAFLIIPYALYHSIPEAYLILSWIAVTIIYYLLSVILKNKKYRWMAHLTLLLTVLYITIIGTMQFEPVYRIISFLIVGVALIIVSLVYTKLKSRISLTDTVNQKANQNK